jgi:predicted nucleotidyltransferase
MLDNKIINKIINVILQVIVPDKIILFGSRAKELAKEDSDYDFLIIKSGIENPLHVEKAIYRKFVDMDELVSVDIVVATPEIVEIYKNVVGSIIKPAIEEGIQVYG